VSVGADGESLVEGRDTTSSVGDGRSRTSKVEQPAGLLAFQCDTCRQRKEFQRVRVVALVFCLFSSFMYTGSQRYSIREARLRCLQNLTMASYESFPVTKSAQFALECHEIEQLTVPVEGSGAVDAMAGMPWELIYPQIVGLRLRRGIVA
jgi:hypothetical protein